MLISEHLIALIQFLLTKHNIRHIIHILVKYKYNKRRPVMALTEGRRGQIALAIVKSKFRRDGLRLSSSARRELGSTAYEIGVPIEELEEFVLDLLPEMISEAFGYDRVSVTTHGRRKNPPQSKSVHDDDHD